MAKGQIKSRDRVVDHAEVFTADREVNAMLDLVRTETERIESRFLEPACGNGNFLAEILRRKLDAAKKASKYKGRIFTADFEKKAVAALCSIYGVELLPDNVAECIERLYGIWDERYSSVMKKEADDNVRRVARFILSKNILCGDTLTMKRADGSPIIFSQWDFVPDDRIKRRDFRLDELMEGVTEFDAETRDDHGDVPHSTFTYDDMAGKRMPDPIREFPLTDYRRIDAYD